MYGNEMTRHQARDSFKDLLALMDFMTGKKGKSLVDDVKEQFLANEKLLISITEAKSISAFRESISQEIDAEKSELKLKKEKHDKAIKKYKQDAESFNQKMERMHDELARKEVLANKKMAEAEKLLSDAAKAEKEAASLKRRQQLAFNEAKKAKEFYQSKLKTMEESLVNLKAS
jgi:chromosome segregation ATPase